MHPIAVGANVSLYGKKNKLGNSVLVEKAEVSERVGTMMQGSGGSSLRGGQEHSMSTVREVQGVGSVGVKIEGPILAVQFSVGSHLLKVVKQQDKNGEGRKVLKVKARRKILVEQESDQFCGMVETGKRKKEDDFFVADEVVTKKAMLSLGIPEVVGAAGLPHHEQ